MRCEQALRLPDFRDGVAIRLADGQEWILPAPPQDDEDAADFGREYEALVGAVQEAVDPSERRLAELCFIIFLLGKNYELDASDYEGLLELAPDRATLRAMQESFHEVAVAHIKGLQARHQPQGDSPTRPQPHSLLSAELEPRLTAPRRQTT